MTKELADAMLVEKNVHKELELVQQRINELREELRQSMQAEGIKSLEESGLNVSRRTKKYPQVVDKDVLERHIESLGLTAGFTVMRFDQVKARNEAVKKGWPGVDVEVRDELVVKAV